MMFTPGWWRKKSLKYLLDDERTTCEWNWNDEQCCLQSFWHCFFNLNFLKTEKQRLFNVDYHKGGANVYLVSSEYLSSAHEGDVHVLSSAQVLADNKERQDFHLKQKLRHHLFHTRATCVYINLLSDNAFNAPEKVKLSVRKVTTGAAFDKPHQSTIFQRISWQEAP